VTLEDLFEELVGEVYDEHDAPEKVRSVQKDGNWRVSGLTPMRKVNELIDADIEIPGVVTVAGLMMNKLGRLAKAGDQVELEGFAFRALEVSGRRILTVDISRADNQA
jgi:CBS domain containing-hemolysin-like protein